MLETISKPIKALVDYDINEKDHNISINNNIAYMYRYPDLTPHVLFLYEMMEASISKDLVEEVIYVVKYDAVKKIIEESYDIPNKELNLLIQLVLQSDGKISNRKKERFLKWIPANDLASLESSIKDALGGIMANAQ